MKYEIYQDDKGNVYKLTTELEQVMIENMSNLTDEIERLNNDIKELFKENSNKEKVIRKQEEIIDKAIEFIKKYGTEAKCELNRYGEHCICASDFNEGAMPLLKILEGIK